MTSPKDQITSFLELCNSDKDLRNSLKLKNNEEITQIAASKGFIFSVEQFESALEPDEDSDELTNADLEMVAGGARPMKAFTDTTLGNTIRSLFSTESGCGPGWFKAKFSKSR